MQIEGRRRDATWLCAWGFSHQDAMLHWVAFLYCLAAGRVDYAAFMPKAN